MNELLEKAKRMYPIGTKFKSLYKINDYVVTKPIFIRYENVYTFDENGDIRCLYDEVINKWAEIVEEEPKCNGYCGSNYCDENGCTERKRVLCEPFYDKVKNKWEEIIGTSTITQEEFKDLKVGDFIDNYEVLHKYNEFLIVKCDDGHDLFDLAKINKLGLKATPKTFMGLEIKKYDNVPCELGGNSLAYLVEVRSDDVLVKTFKDNQGLNHVPSSIRIL